MCYILLLSMPNNEVLLGEANCDGDDDDKSTIRGMLSGVDRQNYLNLKTSFYTRKCKTSEKTLYFPFTEISPRERITVIPSSNYLPISSLPPSRNQSYVPSLGPQLLFFPKA